MLLEDVAMRAGNRDEAKKCVPLAKSSCSTKATEKPRFAASNAQ